MSAAVYSAARAALETMYDGRCTILDWAQQTDAQTHIVRRAAAVTAENVPCRLSFGTPRPAQTDALGAALAQTATLFTAPEHAPKEGARVEITHRGRRAVYGACGPAAVYPTHAETPVALEQPWA